MPGHGQPWDVFRHRYFPDTVEDAEHSRGFLRHLEIVVETGRPVRHESWTRSPSGRRMHAWNTEMWPVRDESGGLIGAALAAFDSSEQFVARQRLAMLYEAQEDHDLSLMAVPLMARGTTLGVASSYGC